MSDYITLFEIPIYSMDERTYRTKWEAKIVKEYGDSYANIRDGKSRFGEYGRSITERYRKQMGWKYRQIVAYIVVCFYEYRSEITISTHGEFYTKEREGAKQRRTSFKYDRTILPHIQITPCHTYDRFNISFNVEAMWYKSNDEIKEKIKSYVSDNIEIYVKNQLYADTALFDATIECIDILKLIELRKKQKQEETQHEQTKV